MILKKTCFASIFLVPLHCQKRNGVLLMEKRHVTTRETACCSETDRVMTKGAKIGALGETRLRLSESRIRLACYAERKQPRTMFNQSLN